VFKDVRVFREYLAILEDKDFRVFKVFRVLREFKVFKELQDLKAS
jgi:hypothetical protein